MFGFRKSAALREVNQRFGQILAVLSGGGDQRAGKSIDGIRAALEKAAERSRRGESDITIARFLAREV